MHARTLYSIKALFLCLRIYIRKSITFILCLIYTRCFIYIIFSNFYKIGIIPILQITSLKPPDRKVVEHDLNQIYYSPHCLFSMEQHRSVHFWSCLLLPKREEVDETMEGDTTCMQSGNTELSEKIHCY